MKSNCVIILIISFLNFSPEDDKNCQDNAMLVDSRFFSLYIQSLRKLSFHIEALQSCCVLYSKCNPKHFCKMLLRSFFVLIVKIMDVRPSLLLEGRLVKRPTFDSSRKSFVGGGVSTRWRTLMKLWSLDIKYTYKPLKSFACKHFWNFHFLQCNSLSCIKNIYFVIEVSPLLCFQNTWQNEKICFFYTKRAHQNCGSSSPKQQL